MEKIDSKDNYIRLIQEYQNLVFSICLKMTGDYFIAEDISQETFLAAYRHYEEFDGQNAKAWICRIASNKCIDYLKSPGRREVLENYDSDSGIEIVSHEEPLNLYINKEVMEDFNKECEKLKEPYKTIAIEHFIRGKTAKAIALERQEGLKTVQTWIYRARQMLQKNIRLEDYA
ncbi:MAG: RNA polymerase sigma factor [Butyrivibrio sp.]|nr:RNA polymerase sigma factor [Butyrivibrio sp.]